MKLWLIEKETKLMLTADRDQEAKSMPKLIGAKEISQRH
jgi:hypothetical protein